MKKIFTLIITLLALATESCFAKDYIYSVEETATPDPASIPKLGVSVTTVPDISTNTAHMDFTECNWQKKVGDNDWEYIYEGEFTPGTWRLAVGFQTSNPRYYEFDWDVTVTINGEPWTLTMWNDRFIEVVSPEYTVREALSGTLGTQGIWTFQNGVLTVDYNGAMPQNCTRQTTDPEIAYRLKWIDFLADIDEVVVTGKDVEIQPYFLYYESSETADTNHPDDHITKLRLGSGVKHIGKSALSFYAIKHVYCYGEEPPTVEGTKIFWWNRVDANQTRLHLLNKSGVRGAYCTTDSEWSKFPVIMNDLDAEDDPVGIKTLSDSPSKGEDIIFNLAGQRLSKMQKGINIVEGKKVLIK